MFMSPGASPASAIALVPVPTETSGMAFSPIGQPSRYGSAVANSMVWKDGLSSPVMAPSTNRNSCLPTVTHSGGK